MAGLGIHQQLVHVNYTCELYVRTANVVLGRDEALPANFRHDEKRHQDADSDGHDDSQLPPLEAHLRGSPWPRLVIDSGI